MPTPKPATQKEMIEQVWWKIFGMNGNDGMANDMQYIKENMVTEKECEERRKHTGAPATSGILKRRAVDAAVIGVIVTVVSNWEKIGKFFEWLSNWVKG